MDIGPCSIPTGEFLVGDPLVYLGSKYEKEYFQKIPIGEFKTEVCIVKASDEDCDRYAAVRLKFNDNEISYFEEAMKGIEDLEDVNEGDFFGFNVDAGLACICDKNYITYIVNFMKSLQKKIQMEIFMMIILQNYLKKAVKIIQNIKEMVEIG